MTHRIMYLSPSLTLKDTTTILIMSLLIMILLIMAIIITLNMGDITYNVPDFYLKMAKLITVIRKQLCNVAFINDTKKSL